MNAVKIGGWILVGLVGGVMLLAGGAKMFGLMPAEEVEKMGAIGEQLRLIGAGCFFSGLLLLIPRTSSIGLLLASSWSRLSPFGASWAYSFYLLPFYTAWPLCVWCSVSSGDRRRQGDRSQKMRWVEAM